MAGTIAIAAPLVQSEAGVHVIHAGIQYEALLRDHHERWSSLISLATDGTPIGNVGLDGARGTRPARPKSTDGASGRSARVLAWARPGGHHRASGRRARERLDRVGAPVAGRPRRAARAVVRRRAGGQPGSGYSRTAPAPFTMTQLADDVREVLRAIGARSATIVGLSMGGMIAQELAINHPDMVERLVLSAPARPLPPGLRRRGRFSRR